MNGLFLAAGVCLVAAVCIAHKPKKYRDCGSQLSTIDDIDVLPCPGFPCIFKKETYITLTLTLMPNTVVSDAKTVLSAIISNVTLPYYLLPDENACHFMSCPLAPGNATIYKMAFYVNPIFPETDLIVKWEAKSSSGELFCFLVPATIVK